MKKETVVQSPKCRSKYKLGLWIMSRKSVIAKLVHLQLIFRMFFSRVNSEVNTCIIILIDVLSTKFL
jgi:hypothetical protein